MTKYFGLIEAGLTLLIVFGIGFWQLRSINKSIAEDKAKAKDD
jgi:hypothetical protein